MAAPLMYGYDPSIERRIEYTIIVDEEDNAKMMAITAKERVLSQIRRKYDKVDIGEPHKLPLSMAFLRFVSLVTCRRTMENSVHCILFDKIPDYDGRWAVRMVRKEVDFSRLEDGYFQGLAKREGVQIHRQEEPHPRGTFRSTCQFMFTSKGGNIVFTKTHVLNTAQLWLSGSPEGLDAWLK